VADIDAARRRVALDRPDDPGAGDTLAYDHLIVASGSTHSYFGHADWEKHAPG
jgi:NADH dehydrogenase